MIASVAWCGRGITVSENPQSSSFRERRYARCSRCSLKGLVNLLPGRGASVVCITQQEAEEFIPLLGTIESRVNEQERPGC
jgi:hypothetical protein